MAGSLNRVELIGNLGADPEIKTSAQGTMIVNFSVATSESWRDKSSGEMKKKTDWHRVVIFGGMDSDGLAGVAEKYLKKGSKVFLAGKLKTRKWQDQSGTDRYTTEIVVQGFGADLVLLDGRSEGPPPVSGADDYGRPSGRRESADEPPLADDEIPF